MTKALYSFAQALARSHPKIRTLLSSCHQKWQKQRHQRACRHPERLRPIPNHLTISLTAHCNLRCEGCLYERGFKTGHVLSVETVFSLLEDAAKAGVRTIRFYGGEPLLHPDLPKMLNKAFSLGLDPYITTNGQLLDRNIERLFEAGLRFLTIGIYGGKDLYDRYTGRPGSYDRLKSNLKLLRNKYGSRLGLQLNWLLMRPTCSPQAFQEALSLARQFGASLQIDLIHYSLPYFSEGPQGSLQLKQKDRLQIEKTVCAILQAQKQFPQILTQSPEGLRSIPDWLLRKKDMRVPCDKYDMLWIGPDGSVQLCYAAFPLGNLKQTPLREILFGKEHLQAAKDSIQLKCPNCHCGFASRIAKHPQSRQAYPDPSK